MPEVQILEMGAETEGKRERGHPIMGSPFQRTVPPDYPATEATGPTNNGKPHDSPSASEAWHKRADELAKWTEKRLVNRRDISGDYYIGDDGKVNPVTSHDELTRARILRHYRARCTADVLGLHTTARIALEKDLVVSQSLWLAIDIDNHDGRVAPAVLLEAGLAWHGALVALGFHPLLTDSDGKGGLHLRVIFEEPIVTAHVRQLGRWLTRDWEERGLENAPELFPKQPEITASGNGSCGNWLRLPGRHAKRDHWSKVWDDGEWLEGDDAIDFILDLGGDSARLIPNDALSFEPEGERKTSSRAGEAKSVDDIGNAREALGYLESSFCDDYGQWLNVGMALYDLGDDGLKLWEEWSSKSSKYEATGPNSCAAKWETFKAAGTYGVTLGTLLWYATKAGHVGPWRKEPSAAPTFDADPRPITVALHPVPELEAWMIPPAFKAWIEDIAERASLPLAYPAAALFVALSGLIGRRLAIRPKQYDDWLVVPNLWGAIVGPPGFLKTPAVEAVMRPLKRLVVDAMKEHATKVQEHNERMLVATVRRDAAKTSLKAAAKKPDATEADLQALAKTALADSTEEAPTEKRYLVNDFTVEKLGELLVENPNGLTVFRDELTGLLNTLNREGHQSDRGFLLESWNGTGSYTFDRIGRGTQHIPAACLSLFGTIQPGPLARYMQGTIKGDEADGFIPRFQVLVYPDPPQGYDYVDRWPNTVAKNDAYQVFKAIDELNPMEKGCEFDDDNRFPVINFTPEAQAFFNEWYTDLQRRLRSGELTDIMAAHLAKHGSLMPSLALIFYLSENCHAFQLDGVPLEAAETAAAWCDYLEAHARRVYLLCADGDVSIAASLAERIKESLPDPFTLRQVAQKGWSGLGTVEDVERAVGILEDRGLVKTVEVKSADPAGRGRPSVKVYIHPKLRSGGEEASS